MRRTSCGTVLLALLFAGCSCGASPEPEAASMAHFTDQARLWLANETIPMRLTPDEVVAGASSLERFVP